MTEPSLKGKRVLITGGGRGIGRSAALAFAAAGASVAVSARSTAEIEQVAAEVSALGSKGIAVPCDVTDPAQVAEMVARTIEELGGLDILINNAGAGESHKIIGHPDDMWHRLININLNSVYYVTKAAVPHMVRQNWGRIITEASIASKVGSKYMAAYTASKHGVLGLTRVLAVELVSYNITANAICPGYVDTPMTDDTVDNIVTLTGMPTEKARQTLENLSPQARLMDPQEVADLAVYLATDAARGINGQAINLDGGMVMF
jgi:3-hydroxybutyrate dehydrogenase